MSSEFLSQEEVDALLHGVTGEDDPAEKKEEDPGGVRPYNLATQERIVRGRMPTLELINERFARYLRLGIFNYMRRNVEVSIGTIAVQKYGEFIRNLVVPTNLNLVQFKPLRGTGLIILDPNLVFLVVDNMFGGDGRFHTRVEGRDFTPTEQRIIQGILSVVFTEYSRSWAPVFSLTPEYIRSEMNSQFANIATPSEITVSTTFTLEIGGIQAEMHICMPYSMIEPVRELLYSPMQSDHLTQDNHWIRTLSKHLKNAEVELICTLGETHLTLRDIVNMRVGDVIPMNIANNIEGSIENTPILVGNYGTKDNHYAFRIKHFIAEYPEDMPDTGDKNG